MFHVLVENLCRNITDNIIVGAVTLPSLPFPSPHKHTIQKVAKGENNLPSGAVLVQQYTGNS